MFKLAGAAALIGLAALSSCTKQNSAHAPAEPLKDRGRRVYMANCIACHNADPTKAGAIGPEVAHSSLELLTARILEAKYPPSYQPKRASSAMAALPHLKDDIPALEAYLAAP